MGLRAVIGAGTSRFQRRGNPAAVAPSERELQKLHAHTGAQTVSRVLRQATVFGCTKNGFTGNGKTVEIRGPEGRCPVRKRHPSFSISRRSAEQSGN